MNIKPDLNHCLITTSANTARRLLDVRGAGESVPALEEELNRRVYGLFGVSPDEVRGIEGGRDEKG